VKKVGFGFSFQAQKGRKKVTSKAFSAEDDDDDGGGGGGGGTADASEDASIQPADCASSNAAGKISDLNSPWKRPNSPWKLGKNLTCHNLGLVLTRGRVCIFCAGNHSCLSPATRETIQRTADWVQENGEALEAVIQQKNAGNPKFRHANESLFHVPDHAPNHVPVYSPCRFLQDTDSPEHQFYMSCLGQSRAAAEVKSVSSGLAVADEANVGLRALTDIPAANADSSTPLPPSDAASPAPPRKRRRWGPPVNHEIPTTISVQSASVQAQQTVVASGEEQAQLKEQAQLQFLEQRIRQMHRQQQVCLF
jgi:hypothetical protein